MTGISRKVVAGLMVCAVALVAPMLAPEGSSVPGATESAGAATYRPGRKWHQMDMLLNSAETRSAATSARGAAWQCAGQIAAAAGILGAPGAVYFSSTCISMVTVCSARALAVGRRAGITFEPYRAWCWNY